ncbi:hypothetical protein [Bdellovibrio bacteriovorus]|uniref:hypothetical protein n=1 Tax=Bdellovibrio bacteriovorus TaxID=959 RepID=UPI0035A72A1B
MLSFLFVLLLSPSSYAAEACPNVGGVVQAVHFLKETDCELAEDVSEAFNDMAKIFGVAPKVTLVIGGPMDNASFDNGYVIRLPYRMVFYGQYGTEHPMPIVNLVTCAAHEYGHAIFHEYVRNTFKNEFSSLLEKFNSLSARSLKMLQGEKDEAYHSDLRALAETRDYQRFHSLISYSEFYADVLAVYLKKDKSAMFSALYYHEMSIFQYNFTRMRDFEGQSDLRWENLMHEEHSWFAITRAFVGEKLWPQDDAQASEYAHKIMKAILNMAPTTFDREERGSPVEDSQRLNEEIQKHL